MLRKAYFKANLRFRGLKMKFAISKYFQRLKKVLKAKNS